MNLDLALKTALTAAHDGRKVLDHYFGNLRQIDEKLHAGLVSEADRESELTIIKTLRATFPESNVLGEEGGLNEKSGSAATWIIDPLDGTTNYIHQYPYFCISIGLEIQGQIQVAVIEVPILNRTYTAIRGRGTYCNGNRVYVRKTEQFRDTLLATGFFVSPRVNLDRQTKVFKKAVETVRGVRRCGSAALELAFVADGTLDGFWEYGLNPWDTAAGLLLIEEAGGKVTNDKGGVFNVRDDGCIVAGNSIAHDNILKMIHEFS